MTKTKTYRWEGAGTKLPDGHCIFETHDHPDGSRWAIADESGQTPDQTDDGVLWLNRDRPLVVGWNVFDEREYKHVPLLREDGAPTVTLTDTRTLLYLSRMFSWVIEDDSHGRFYNAR